MLLGAWRLHEQRPIINYRPVSKTRASSGISGATSHSGRRTGLTNLAERGVGVRVLMALAGHSNMATTQRYIDLRPAMLKAAVELV